MLNQLSLSATRRSLNYCKLWLLPLFLCGGLLGCCTHYTNLAQYKQDLRQYYKSRYFPEINAKIRPAEEFLRRRSQTPGENLAVVLDIDETSLSNWEEMANQIDFGFNPGDFDHWAETEQAPAIDAVLRLSKLAQTNHVSVFFITGRREKLRAATEENLRRAGYDHWAAIYLAPNDVKFVSIADFKTQARAKITADGFHIILNVGDQWSDLRGGYSERCVKLPNPFYFLP